MKNKIFLSEKFILQKIEEPSHTLTSFSRYVTTIMLNNYSNIGFKHSVTLVVANDYVSILIIVVYCKSMFVYLLKKKKKKYAVEIIQMTLESAWIYEIHHFQ